MVKLHVSWFHVSFPFFSRDITRPIPLFKTPLCVRNDDALPESFRAHSSLHLMWLTRRSVKAKHVWGWYVPEESEKPSKNILKKLGTKKHMNSSKTFNKQNKMFYHQLGWGAQIRCLICFWEFHQGFDPRLCSARATSSRVHGRPGPLIFLHALPPPIEPKSNKMTELITNENGQNEHPGL